MKTKKFLSLFKDIRPTNFLFLTLAGIINATGVTLFLSPVSVYDGGFSGTSVFLSQLTPLSVSVFLLILNVPFFLLGLKKMGVPFIVYSLYTVGIYSLFAYLYQYVFGLDFSQGSPVAGNDLLLCAVFGGIISGIGSGTTIRFGGAIDGVEVTAVMFAKKLGMTVGSFVMTYNVILYVIAGIVTKSWITPLYSVIAYAVGIKAVDFIIDGFDKAKSAFIITENHNLVAEKLTEEFGRGVTEIDATGYYSKTDKTVLYCVVNRFEVNKLKAIVTSVDPSAFLVINDVTDTLGSSLKYERLIRRRVQNRKLRSAKQSENTTAEINRNADTDNRDDVKENASNNSEIKEKARENKE